MKILDFWVTGVTQKAIPNMLSNAFQEATRCYNTKLEYTGCWYATGIHASIFFHILCPEKHYKEPQVEFFLHLHWHDCTGFSGTGLAQQKESVLPCGLFRRNMAIKLLVRIANFIKPTDFGFICSHQYIFVEKHWRMFRFLSPTCFKQFNNWKERISKWALYKHYFLQPSIFFFCWNHTYIRMTHAHDRILEFPCPKL